MEIWTWEAVREPLAEASGARWRWIAEAADDRRKAEAKANAEAKRN